ncbi:predicted protein [Histoplasma capsulatum H143]|uniref:Uncharacterized protein n=1 Tax=Ajellomyces capsulatus (strain H143) TaxID=544712 RepID=C6HIE6_AJECH|nr:predicted protein [Histoplasma capsulatum H143]
MPHGGTSETLNYKTESNHSNPQPPQTEDDKRDDEKQSSAKEGMGDIVKADSSAIRVAALHTEGTLRAKVTLCIDRACSSIRQNPGLTGTCANLTVTPAELDLIRRRIQSKVILVLGINPDASPAHAGLEALDAYNGEQEPEKTNEKGNMDQ